MTDLIEPITPYAGTSGWSGSDTSRDRALHQDSSGRTLGRQQQVLSLVTRAGAQGMTAAEVDAMGAISHRGSTSGALSNLHKVGRLCRLVERRHHNKVYVAPEYVGDRPVEAQGRTVKGLPPAEVVRREKSQRVKDAEDRLRSFMAARVRAGLGDAPAVVVVPAPDHPRDLIFKRHVLAAEDLRILLGDDTPDPGCDNPPPSV